MIKKSQIQGEWWIDSFGYPLYADGDIGDKNHEAYVIEYIQSQYADPEFSQNEYVDWEGFETKVLEEKLRELNVPHGEKDQEILIQALKEKGMSNEEIQIARGVGDAREYGIKNLGWKRVISSYVETYTLTNEDLHIISRGLEEAYPDLDDDPVFEIEVRANNSLYEDVPLSVISQSNITNLFQYKNKRRYASKNKFQNWYSIIKTSSARDEKNEQLKYIGDNIREAISQAMIGGDETIKIIDRLINRLNGANGFRNLIGPNLKNIIIKILTNAKSVKKDSPHKCVNLLEEALSYLI